MKKITVSKIIGATLIVLMFIIYSTILYVVAKDYGFNEGAKGCRQKGCWIP